MAKIAGTMAKSTQIMEMMNNLIKLPQLHASMMQMGQEMTKVSLPLPLPLHFLLPSFLLPSARYPTPLETLLKVQQAGLLEEMISEVFEDDEVDEEASEEVEKIMMSLTNEVLNQGAKVTLLSLLSMFFCIYFSQTGTTTCTTSSKATCNNNNNNYNSSNSNGSGRG